MNSSVVCSKYALFWGLVLLSFSLPGLTDSIRDRPHYEAMVFSSNAAVNSPQQIWDFTSFYLYRKENYGDFAAIVNYANRLGVSSSQIFFNAIPKFLNNKLWIDTGYGYANAPEIFPNNEIRFEPYVKVSDSLVFSIGDTYKTVLSTFFHTFTGSIGKYMGYYYFSFRPYHYVPKVGPRSTLLRFQARRYWDNPDKNIGISFSGGTSPDLFDLLTLNFFKVQDYILFIDAQQPINDKWLFTVGAGYETQLFPSGFLRRLSYVNFGITVRME